MFAIVEAKLGDSAVGDGCTARTGLFNKDVFVGPKLMGHAIEVLVASSSVSPASLRVLNGLVVATRSPLVDKLNEEVSEGLSQGEKRATKLEILPEVAVSPVEEATVLAEVLRGATP
ncbi:hypothetical protein E2562_022952 [Oryza meyeriana var. granulata]|uniref:Uncharacterized protein n=1 Tax=Oryza meyeriana var. granulata TaxID=110450 RepID=A0A6G1D6V7_9ORYZ|nr:hypothetical protein E2562_022952 [Oryza meyeriana var. granulata]